MKIEFFETYAIGGHGFVKPGMVSRRAFRSKKQAGQAALNAGIITSAWDSLRFLKETCYTRKGTPFTGYRIIKPEVE